VTSVSNVDLDLDGGWPVPTEASRALNERARRVIPGGVSGYGRLDRPYPLYMTRAEGAYIEDVDGNRYVDFNCALGTVLLGHNDPRLRETIDETLPAHGVSLATAHPVEVEFAERLTRIVPSAERVTFALLGTEMTYHALRLARSYTGRRQVVKFEGNYHGWHDYLFWSVRFDPADAGPPTDPIPIPASNGMRPAADSEVLVCGFNDTAHLEELFARRGGEISAVIVEPIFHNAGVVMPAPGFLEACRELCTRHGALLVFDEIVTGFRQALGGAQAIFGITPDLTTLGKGIANGFPLSVLAGRADVMDTLAEPGGAYVSGTYNGHLLMVAIGDRCCRILEEDPPYDRLAELGGTLRRGIEEAIAETGVTASVSQFGSVWGLYFTRRPITSYRDIARFATGRIAAMQLAYRRFMLSRGFYFQPHNVIRAYMSAAHTPEHVREAVAATREFFELHADDLRDEL
jgi:glutamate-1-semialdehyde 2,1-aminomutase